MSPDQFITALDKGKGLAPLNRFVAKIKFPDALKPQAPTEELSLVCDSAPMPGRTIATAELRHYGPTRKVAREMTYGEFSLGFIMTNTHSARNSFLQWMDYAVNPVTADMRYSSQYKGSVKVLMFAQDSIGLSSSEASFGAEYLESFPTVVDPITLGWDQTNTVGKFNVTFHYKTWKPLAAAGYADPNAGSTFAFGEGQFEAT